MNVFTLQWQITNETAGMLVREFLKQQEVSKTALTDIKFGGGDIVANNIPVTVRYSLKEGDILQVRFPPEKPSEDMEPENLPLSIVYEDDYLLVVNKPPSMSTIPSREHPTGSLANALLFYYSQKNIASTIHIVNRLDRDTSGLLIVAKHRYTHHLFSKQQKVRKISRRYEAFVHGVVAQSEGEIHAPIGRKDTSIIEREVRDDGQDAITFYKVLSKKHGFTHVSIKLETGRTHQIRVHMAYLGHPLLGDDLYGGPRELISRQALHSTELSFIHPITKKNMNFAVPLPDDMKQLLN